MKERADRMAAFLEDFKKLKDQLVDALMWDICKSRKDATDEVDRTIGMQVDWDRGHLVLT